MTGYLLCLDHGVVVILDIGHKRETQPAAARARAVCSKYVTRCFHRKTQGHTSGTDVDLVQCMSEPLYMDLFFVSLCLLSFSVTLVNSCL